MPDRLDPTFVRAQIANLRTAYPQMDEDEQLRLDMLEGSTDLHEFLAGAVDRLQDAKAKINGLGQLICELKVRQDRFDQRVEAMRALAFRVMQAADVRKLELPAATLSIRGGQPKVIITDEAALPPDCVRVRTEPDRVKIKNELMRGEPVAGAELSNSEPTLAVRVK